MPRFLPIEELFKGRHFDREIVMLCVRWYLSYRLNCRDLVAIMGERGMGVAHTTILRWLPHDSPELDWKEAGTDTPGRWVVPGGATRPRSR